MSGKSEAVGTMKLTSDIESMIKEVLYEKSDFCNAFWLFLYNFGIHFF
jgi:hypothetical protein